VNIVRLAFVTFSLEFLSDILVLSYSLDILVIQNIDNELF